MQPTNRLQRTPRLALLASTLALVLGSAGLVHSQTPPAAQGAPAQGAVVQAPPTAAVSEMQRLSDGFAQVADAVLPAVVSIRVEATREEPEMALPIPFGNGRGGGGESLVHGSGSGVLIRADGLILTNNHVVEGARRIDVHLRDGRVFRAQVLGTDPSTDLAVIRVNATGLPIARFADSERARVGEWVLAIGSPFGLEATVTHGVLSAKGRAGLGANAIEDYLQTDASINPGNSGGPLVNLHGEVLGINTMILGRGTGVGFAVPSRLARVVAEQLAATGEVSRGWIGVGVQDLAAPLADALHLPSQSGAIVSLVEPQGPSARAGLRVGDVITQVNGQPVQFSHDVVRSVTDRRPGDSIDLAVLRNGRTEHIAVTSVRRPGERREAQNNSRLRLRAAAHEEPVPLGLEVMPLDARGLRMVGAQHAVVVTAVEPGGAAARAGMRRGDVILRADNREAASAADVDAAMQDGSAALLVRRRDAQIYVPVQTN